MWRILRNGRFFFKLNCPKKLKDMCNISIRCIKLLIKIEIIGFLGTLKISISYIFEITGLVLLVTKLLSSSKHFKSNVRLC